MGHSFNPQSTYHTTNNARSLPLYEGYILQMLAEMEQMKEQARSDCDRTQGALDRENAAREQEALKQSTTTLGADRRPPKNLNVDASDGRT